MVRPAALLAGALALTGFLLLETTTAFGAPAEAVCPVCHVDEGTTSAEPVRASRMHEGKELYFCSERCAKTFERHPERYLAAAMSGAAADTVSSVFFPRISTTPT